MSRKPDVRERLLRAAEVLFAEEGFAGTSVRRLTEKAGANLAAINYYFEGKEGLFLEAVGRHLRPLNQERLRLLEEYEESLGERKPAVEPVLRAFLSPAFDLLYSRGRQGRAILRLLSKSTMGEEKVVGQLVTREFQELADRFGLLLSRAVPSVGREELFWRMHYTAGAFLHTLHQHHNIELLSGGLCNCDDRERVETFLVHFCAGGFRAKPSDMALVTPASCK